MTRDQPGERSGSPQPLLVPCGRLRKVGRDPCTAYGEAVVRTCRGDSDVKRPEEFDAIKEGARQLFS
jgi:hypothetical protein